MNDVLQRNPSHDSIAQWLDDLLVLLQRLHFDSAQGSAIFFIDDDILCHIHKTTCQIARICGLECGICQSLTRSVRGDEVLQNGKSFLEVRDDRVFDDLSSSRTGLLRLGHQAPHARELTDLFFGSTGTGIEHHVDRVESLIVGAQIMHGSFGQSRIGVGPDIDHLIVSLVVGDQTHIVASQNAFDLLVGSVDDVHLLLWDDDVFQRETQSSAESRHESKALDIVQELGSLSHICEFDDPGDDVPQRLFGQDFVDEAHSFRHCLVEEHTAHCGLYDLWMNFSVLFPNGHLHLDDGMLLNTLLVEGDLHLFRRVEGHTFSLYWMLLGSLTGLGHVVQAEDHVLRRYCDR